MKSDRCARCGTIKNAGPKCEECGVRYDRQARRIRRSRPIGGKRGRNSGTTNTSKK